MGRKKGKKRTIAKRKERDAAKSRAARVPSPEVVGSLEHPKAERTAVDAAPKGAAKQDQTSPTAAAARFEGGDSGAAATYLRPAMQPFLMGDTRSPARVKR